MPTSSIHKRFTDII